VRDALAAGASETGTTIHWVDEGVDTGEIIAQERLEITATDTEESLHERIKIIERGLIVATIPQILAELK
jgi:phosphoribosylglycinamide formyltransferase-1